MSNVSFKSFRATEIEFVNKHENGTRIEFETTYTYNVKYNQNNLCMGEFTVEVFDKHPVKNWWWLATPDSAKPHYDPVWTVCVSPSGGIYGGYYSGDYGVRPILIFESSIFESSEE